MAKYSFPRAPLFALRVKRGISGLGLYALEDIPKGRFVVEYWGDLMTDEKAQEVGGRYLFEIGNGKTINGTSRENIARYANHSCRPNSEIRIQGNRVFIFSRKKVTTGQEITYDYGKEYFDWFIKPNGCRCQFCTIKKK